MAARPPSNRVSKADHFRYLLAAPQPAFKVHLLSSGGMNRLLSSVKEPIHQANLSKIYENGLELLPVFI